MKCGMSCSLFEVVDGKGKPTSGSLAGLVNKLERDRMVSHPVAVTYQVLMLGKSPKYTESVHRISLSAKLIWC